MRYWGVLLGIPLCARSWLSSDKAAQAGARISYLKELNINGFPNMFAKFLLNDMESRARSNHTANCVRKHRRPVVYREKRRWELKANSTPVKVLLLPQLCDELIHVYSDRAVKTSPAVLSSLTNCNGIQHLSAQEVKPVRRCSSLLWDLFGVQ